MLYMPVNLIQLLHKGMTGQFLYNVDISAGFAISSEVKLSCVPIPILFNLFFAFMLSHHVQGLKEGLHQVLTGWLSLLSLLLEYINEVHLFKSFKKSSLLMTVCF